MIYNKRKIIPTICFPQKKIKLKEDFEVLSNLNLDESEALFISCTALPALDLIDKLEKKLNKLILSSNQTLIWEALNLIGNKEIVKGYGNIFEIN